MATKEVKKEYPLYTPKTAADPDYDPYELCRYTVEINPYHDVNYVFASCGMKGNQINPGEEVIIPRNLCEVIEQSKENDMNVRRLINKKKAEYEAASKNI